MRLLHRSRGEIISAVASHGGAGVQQSTCRTKSPLSECAFLTPGTHTSVHPGAAWNAQLPANAGSGLECGANIHQGGELLNSGMHVGAEAAIVVAALHGDHVVSLDLGYQLIDLAYRLADLLLGVARL